MILRTLAPIIAALLVAGFVVTFAPDGSIKTITPPGMATTTPATATTTPAKKPKETVSPKKTSEKDKLTAAGGELLGAVVNIYCTTDPSSPLRGTSGSGVIMDSRGLILTASHVAQLFLLTDYPKRNSTHCVVRTGGPAHDAYTAEIAYLSPAWVGANARSLSLAAPKGNGQHDFAVLAITGSASGEPLPAKFPFLPLSDETPKIGDRLAIGGYAAQYLDGSQIRSMLYPTIVFDAVTDQYTFGNNKVDVLSIKGTAAAQEGSSGGALANADGEIVGVITTSATQGSVKNHELNAITPYHVRSSFKTEMGQDFDTYFSSHTPAELVSLFAPKALLLRGVLTSALIR